MHILKIVYISLHCIIIYYFLEFTRPKNIQVQPGLVLQTCILSNHSDTCIIGGFTFELVENGSVNGLRAIIKNGRIRIVSELEKDSKFRVIRYVFSIRRDENYSSVRHYGDLISYPVINLLKSAETGDLFYFEDIIIVDPHKEIIENAVKPIIIRKI